MDDCLKESVKNIWHKIAIDENLFDDENSIWHNLFEKTAIKLGPPIETPTGPHYSQVGTLRGLMIVIDFPDARGRDNTGTNGWPGEKPEDKGNYVNGHRLKTAKDYYDWMMPPARKYFQTTSYGKMDFDVTLVENPKETDGIFTLKGNLYGDDGYNMKRGGDVNRYLKDAFAVAKSELLKQPDAFDIIYVVAVENAVGISYGPMDTNGDTPNSQLGTKNFKALVRIGYDTYSGWRYKGVVHETLHALGMPDFYIGGFSGPGGGQVDPVSGETDYYSIVGHWDVMGYINGHAPDSTAWNKWRLGWLSDDQVDIVTEEGTTGHRLYPLGTPGGTKLIAIPGERRGVLYCVEYRAKAGVDDTAVTEATNDPSGQSENATWPHKYGTFDNPGILIYKVDANVPTMHGPMTVVNLTPKRCDIEFARVLDKSVLGPSSGIYIYTDVAAGLTVSIGQNQPEPGEPYGVTIDRFAPFSKHPSLISAQFIDLNTVEIETGTDIRGIMGSQVKLTKSDGSLVEGVKINMITSTVLRVSFNGGQFSTKQETSGVTVATDGFGFFDESEAIEVKGLL